MGKLVRDRIPEIIKTDGKNPKTRILLEEEYLQELDKKLNEEVAEYQADKSIEEMADVLMYYNDVLLCYGISEEELKETYISKFEKNMKRW